MADYKVILHEDIQDPNDTEITWEPDCPLVLEAIQVSRCVQTGEAYLQMKLRNVGNEEICSFRALATAVFENGKSEDVEIALLDADIKPGEHCRPTPVPLERGDVSKINGKICSLRLPSGNWESGKEEVPFPRPKDVNLSEKARAERLRQWHPNPPLPGDLNIASALNKDINNHDLWWVCPCGQLNVNREICLLCDTPKTFWNAHPANNEQLEKEADERAEKEARERAIKETEREKKKQKSKRVARIALISGLIVAAATLLLVMVFQIVHCVVPGVYVVTRCTTTDSTGMKESVEYTLDDQGNVVKRSDSEGVFEYKRDDYGIATEINYETSNARSAACYTTVESMDGNGQPTKVSYEIQIRDVGTQVEPRRGEYGIEWFGEGRIHSISDTYDGSSGISTDSYTYNESGELLDRKSDSFSSSYTYKYDSGGRVTAAMKTIDNLVEITTKYTYDDHGNVIRAETDYGSVIEWEYVYVMNPSPVATLKSKCFLGQENLPQELF